jgi:molybdenum cofactor biosynthesis enzyme MoaA
VDLPSADELLVRFSATQSRDWVEVRVVPLGLPGPFFRKLKHCQVRYRASIAQTGESGREAVLHLVLAVATAVDTRMATQPRASIAEVMGRRADRDVIEFTPEGLRELLTPWIVEGLPVAGVFTLADVYPASRTMLKGSADSSLVLDFVSNLDERVFFRVSPHDANSPSFARSAHLQLDHVSMGRMASPEVETLRALVSFVLQLNDHPRLRVLFASDALVLPEGSAMERAGEHEVLNLAISSECGQRCVFCSVKSTAPAYDGGDETFASLAADLGREARRGVRGMRLNGYDPLSYSRVIDVARLATSLGYTRVQVFSPATRLADAAFAEALFAALPPEREVYVPLYGARAEVHDEVVGKEGAFDEVMRALDHLARMKDTRVALLGVTTQTNQRELYALAKFAEARRLPLSAHFPYPSFESRADRYFASAPKQSEVTEALFEARAEDATSKLSPRDAVRLLEGVAPCIVHRLARKHDIKLAAWLPETELAPPLPGTEYRDKRYRHRVGDTFSAATVPCPHADQCAMRTLCPGVLLRAYVDLHGDQEFMPITLREILAAG